MGQARIRGIREDRIVQAQERDAAAREAAVRDEMDWWEAMTPEEQGAERERKRHAHQKAAELRAMAILAMRGAR